MVSSCPLSLSACRFSWELVWLCSLCFFHIWQYRGYVYLLTDFEISKPYVNIQFFFVLLLSLVCTAQFVVMFTSANSLKEGKVVCNAYISQSTRSLRSLLKEHVRYFSFCLKSTPLFYVTIFHYCYELFQLLCT